MGLPTGLLPVLAFVLTVGTAVPVTAGAHLLSNARGGSFAAALRTTLLAAGGLYIAGVAALWALLGIGRWEVAAALLLAGTGVMVAVVVLPLAVGRWLVRRVRGVDPDTGLRFATYGWPVAVLAVFVIFVAPGGSLLALGGPRVCLAGSCGVSVQLVAAVLLEALVALLGPGLAGLALLPDGAA